MGQRYGPLTDKVYQFLEEVALPPYDDSNPAGLLTKYRQMASVLLTQHAITDTSYQERIEKEKFVLKRSVERNGTAV